MFQIEALPDSELDKLQGEAGPPQMGNTSSPPVETYPCRWCGHCENPENCVWSVTCPSCNASPGTHCVARGSVASLHTERWAQVGKVW